MQSPLLALPGAVAGDGIDAPVAAHYGSFNTEQRSLARGDGFVDLSHRDVVRISGPERLSWLHNLTTQYFDGLAPGTWTQALVLSPQGHVEHAFTGVDDGEAFTAHTEPGAAAPLAEWLDRMRFMMRVEVEDLTDELAVAWRPGPDGEGKYDVFPRADLEKYAEAAGPACGMWAFEALRVEARRPRLHHETDHRTIPHEVGWINRAVHLDKGCYRGQETVARVHNLGRPPRRLVLLHLDGSDSELPVVGDPVQLDGRDVGRVGTAVRHHELGPIALALVKRNVPDEAELVAGSVAARIDPEPAAEAAVSPARQAAAAREGLMRFR